MIDAEPGRAFDATLGIHPRPDVLSRENGRDLVGRSEVVFVPGNDEDAIVVRGPKPVSFEVILQPTVGHGDAAVVHVVLLVRHND